MGVAGIKERLLQANNYNQTPWEIAVKAYDIDVAQQLIAKMTAADARGKTKIPGGSSSDASPIERLKQYKGRNNWEESKAAFIGIGITEAEIHSR